MCNKCPGMHLLILSLIVLSYGCGDSSSPPEKAPNYDQSLTRKAYESLGAPTPEKVWDHKDITKVSRILKDLAQSTPEKLPRLLSPKSGEIFARIVSTDYVEKIEKQKLATSEVGKDLVEYCEGLTEILKLYQKASKLGIVRDVDIVEIYGSFLRSMVGLVHWIDRFAKTLNPDSPDYAERMQKLQKVPTYFFSIVKYTLLSLTERDRYSRQSLFRLVRLIRQTVPTLTLHLRPPDQQEVLRTLAKVENNIHIPDLQPELRKLKDHLLQKLNQKKEAD